ncbi:MAG TPA: RES family NAD+ phosphorylase [Flavisolibacter sp.]|nr:RES family NAD+ phosphorylase [Flavisolibacter sp.]
MDLYRIVKNKSRVSDLSGMGAFIAGGRCNSPGTYMLYTSESSSLALLESLVHFDPEEFVPNLYVMKLQLAEHAPVLTLPDKDYPKDWTAPESLKCNALGDQIMSEARYLALKVKSAVNPIEYNYLLNPLFPGFHDLVKVSEVTKIPVDPRLNPPTEG